MKVTFNLTTDPEDLDRFESAEELLGLMEGFDGVELMCYEPDTRGLIPKSRVVGLHMCFFPYWLDLWRGDEAALLREFGSREALDGYYGGSGPEAMIARFRKDLDYAKQYGAEYVVFHVSNCTIEESFTRRYRDSDAEVIDAACEVISEAFGAEDGGIALLMENLWMPGLTFTDPVMTERLLSGVKYQNKGIMLDTGHLLHTDTKLSAQEEGLEYINGLLDRHGDLVQAVRGIHLNQSLTGAYSESMMDKPPSYDLPYAERSMQTFFHAYAVDKHEPFTCPGVSDLIRRISPEYLTFEFITSGLADHRTKLDEQRKYCIL